MKEKAIQAVNLLERIRSECRILNKDNLPLLGMEQDSMREAIKCLGEFVEKSDEKLVNSSPNPQ